MFHFDVWMNGYVYNRGKGSMWYKKFFLNRISVCVIIALSAIFTISCEKNDENETSGISNNTDAPIVVPITTETPTSTPTPAPTSNPLTKRDCDFRDVCWGDSMETVRALETLEVADEDDKSLLCEGSLDGYDVIIIYDFEEDKLYQGEYMLNDNLMNGGRYLMAYNSWKENLIKKYGEPLADSPGIMYSTDKDTVDSIGEDVALEIGYTGYKYHWQTDTTDIVLGLVTIPDYQISMYLTYSDKNHFESDESLEGF